MLIYIYLQAIIGILGGILLAVLTKKTEGVIYSKLDRAGIILNIVLIPVYIIPAPLYLFLGLICRPNYDGFL